MRETVVLFLIIVLASCVGSGQDPASIRFPYEWIGPPGYGGFVIEEKEFVEPSGLDYHPIRKTLFVVSDEGLLMEFNTDGTQVFTMEIPGDLEGVAVHPKSGLVYIIHEGEDIILEFDPQTRKVLRKFPLNRSFGGNPNYIEKRTEDFDNGVESITFVPDEDHPEGGTFFMGNQWDPSCIMEVLVPLKSAEGVEAEATILRVLPFDLDDPAAMFYDTRTGYLNIVNDADNILYELTLDGELMNQYAFLGDNQEGITRDDSGFLYIAQDNGGILKVKDLRFARED
ncbi:SdiA-regulated domain-containing protein [Acidobacteriota bacterium]